MLARPVQGAPPAAWIENRLAISGLLRIGGDAVATRRLAGDALEAAHHWGTPGAIGEALCGLARLGFDVAAGDLVTPAALAVRHCLHQGRRRVALVMNETVKEDFAELEEVAAGAEAVIVGDLGSAFGYDVLNRAFRAVMDGAQLVALQKNRFWLTPDGLSLDVGPFVAALEYATGREAFVVGKPAAGFFATVLADLGVEPAAGVMVGDDVESDVGGALRAGLAGVLVRTGKYRADAVRASGVRPTVVVDSIADVPALLPSDGAATGPRS